MFEKTAITRFDASVHSSNNLKVMLNLELREKN